mgnify:CR=1 FL=1
MCISTDNYIKSLICFAHAALYINYINIGLKINLKIINKTTKIYKEFIKVTRN